MGRILVVRGPKMSRIWYVGGPKGNSIKNRRVLRGFHGFRGSQGGQANENRGGAPGRFLATGGDYQGGKLDFQTSGPKVPIS